jgi:hypothetical protein
MNCNLCGCEGAYLAHKVGRKVITICGDCWYYEDKTERRRESMKAIPAMCGDHLVPISECDCLSYMREIAISAERLIQLAQEREELTK